MSQSFSAPVALRKKLINALIDRFANSPASIVAAISRDQPANPILFRRDLYPDPLKLTDDDRGLSLLEKHEKLRLSNGKKNIYRIWKHQTNAP